MEGQVLIREIIFEIIVNQLDSILTATFNGKDVFKTCMGNTGFKNIFTTWYFSTNAWN